MLYARLTQDNRFLIVEGDGREIRQVRLSFTKKVNSWYIIKSKNPDANVDEQFMTDTGMIPVGLWVELVNVCKKFGYELKFYSDFDERTKDVSVTRESFGKFVDNLFKDSSMKLRGYQIDGTFSMVYYKNCCVEISTSGGKTVISYVLFHYLKDVCGMKHILLVTPKTNLTTQTSKKFLLYDEKNNIKSDWTYSEIHANAKKKKSYDSDNIVFGNYQSLCNRKSDFFEKFDAVIFDEAHHGQNNSCRTIIKKCRNAEYKIGMTGTFPEAESFDSFVIQSFIGPLVYRFTSYELINEEKFATPVHVHMFALRYLDEERMKALYGLRNVSKKDDPTVGNMILKEEKIQSRKNRKRFEYIVNLAGKVTKNTLILFSDIQNNYGKSVYDTLRERCEKNIYYIDGTIPTLAREKMIQAMEDDLTGNTIIVASIQCFSEGIDIGNMWNIFLIETTKSENTLAQILGRGMRRFEGKDKTVMIDFVDDFRYGEGYYHDNYLWKHGMSRMDIYRKRGFPCNLYEIDLNK